MYVTETGAVYSVGHGKGGRLGIANEKTIVVPELVSIQTSKKQPEFIISVSTAKNHSLALTKSGTVSFFLRVLNCFPFKYESYFLLI